MILFRIRWFRGFINENLYKILISGNFEGKKWQTTFPEKYFPLSESIFPRKVFF